jgi:hypothetical protein
LLTGTGSSAAWLARSVRDAEAAGSNPAFPTRKWLVRVLERGWRDLLGC